MTIPDTRCITDLVIREATVDDAAGIARVLNQAIAARTHTVDATYRSAREKGYEKIFTFVRADNDAAIKTYLNEGFQIIGTAQRQARIDGRYIDEVLIERFLEH